MSDEQPTVWVIRIRDDIRAHMATNPPAEFADSPELRDWHLRNLHRKREDYTVEEVPGPLDHAKKAEQERWEQAKADIRREARQRFLDSKRRGSGG